jgi:hypothetical protein
LISQRPTDGFIHQGCVCSSRDLTIAIQLRRAQLDFQDHCACRRHQCCLLMIVRENFGTFSLFLRTAAKDTPWHVYI